MMLSAVIPAREEERDIEATIRQFDAVTMPHEVIVSDGGSLDRTKEVAERCRARVITSPGTPSPAKQRNAGAQIATGDYILFLDVTVLLPDIERFLAQAIAHFEKDSSVVALAVPQWIYADRASFADRFFLMLTNAMLRLQGIGSGKFMLVRRSAFVEAGGFNEALMTREDGDLFIRLKGIGKVIFDTELYITYAGRREHAWGWPKLLYIWTRDTLAVTLLGRSLSKDWTPVR